MKGKLISPAPGTPLRTMPSPAANIATAGTIPENASLEILDTAGGYAAVSLDGETVSWVPLASGPIASPAAPLPRLDAVLTGAVASMNGRPVDMQQRETLGEMMDRMVAGLSGNNG